MIKDLFGILATVNVSVINYMMLENLDYKNRKCRNKLVDILVEECSENDSENEMIYITNDYGNMCNSCAAYMLLFVVAFLIIIGNNSAFDYFNWYLKKSNTNTEAIIY